MMINGKVEVLYVGDNIYFEINLIGQESRLNEVTAILEPF